MKRILSFLLIISILISSVLVALPISAEEENYAPVGSPIETLADLKRMQTGGSYYLTDNITLDGTWTPIVGDNITLDGKDSTGAAHTVTFAGGAYSLFGECTNLTVKNINFDGTIVFENESIAYLSPVSCGNLKGSTTLTDIVSDVDITVNKMIGYNDGNHNKGQTVAGVVAYMSGHPVGGVASTITLRNLSFTGSLHVKCRLQTMGGVLGRVLSARNDGGNATIENCTNYGALSVTPRHEKVDSSTNADTGVTSYWDVYSAVDAMGGVAGVIATSESTVIGCKNVAPITFNTISGDALGDYTGGTERGGDFTFLGGIAGNVWGDNVVIEDCHNLPEGDFLYGRTSSTDGYAGGLIGRFANIFGEARIENCTNHGDLNCAWVAGRTAGLVAVVSNISNGGIMKGCINYGKVAAGEMRGGMGGVIADIIHETETDQKNPNYGKYYNCNFTVERCENYGNVTYDSTTGLGNSQNCALGGIVGKVEFKGDTFDQYTVDQKAVIDKVYVIACYNKGDVKNNNPTNGVIAVEAHHVGGIVGKAIALAHLEIRHCINAGNISIYDTNERGNGWADVGGILGGIMTINGTWSWSYIDTGDFYIYDCHNFGNLKGGYTGGIFGATYQIYHDIRINIEGCTNHGTVTTAYRTYTNSAGNETNEGSYAGGIVASLDIADKSYGSLYIKNCLNTGSVTGSTVGGILGVRLETGGTRPGITQIINCSNTGKIHSIYPSHVAAGIVGAGHGTALTVKYCSNSGEITNASATGVALPIGPDYSNATTGDGYTVLTKENNYYTKEGVSGNKTPLGELNTTKAAELLAANTELAYSKGTVTDGGLYSTDSHTYYILSEAHLTSATRENVELKLYNNITVENADPELSRALINSKFDGNEKTVTFQNGGLFLFDCVQNSEIRNLNLTGNISSTTNGYLAPLASEGSSYGLVLEDITSSVDITVTPDGMIQIGGVIGRIVTADSGGSGTATLRNVTYSGTIKSFADVATGAAGGVVGNIGGISPTLQGDITVTDCSSSGDITSKGLSSDDHSAAGGLFGSIEKNVTISDCEYTGAISIEDERVCAGGIAGHIYALTPNDVISVSDCDNYGTVASGSAAGIVGGVCAYFDEDAMSNASTDLSYLNQFNTMKITIENCQNAGGATIKGKRNSSGILGDVTMIYSQRLNDNAANNGHLQPDLTVRNCVNSAAVESYTRTMGGNVYVSGIVACTNRGLIIDCINEGDIYGVMRTAGIVGAKHKPTAEMLTVKNCKNTGDVTGRLYSGGIMSMCWRGNMEILNCVNAGTVTSFGFDNKDSEFFAGGILGYMGGNAYNTGEEWLEAAYNDGRTTIIDHCVNAGAVVLSGATGIDAPRLTDGWRCAGGIVSTTKVDITITNCVNLGRITTDPNNPDYAAYPIANGDELPISTSIPLYQLPERLITASGNYYLEGSVLNPTVDGETKDFHFSEMGDAATLEALIREADVYVFDKTAIDSNDTETIAGIAKDIIANGYDGMYTDEQRADLSANYTNTTTVYGNADPYLKQNTVYDAEDDLRDAVFAYTDEARYIVYLPVGNLEGDREYTVEFRPTDFSRFASAEVTIDSENDYKLTDSHGNVLNYVLKDKNDTVYTDGSLLFEREAMKNASNTAISKVIKAVVTPNDAMPAGTYRDTISYTITYHSGKPNEGT